MGVGNSTAMSVPFFFLFFWGGGGVYIYIILINIFVDG